MPPEKYAGYSKKFRECFEFFDQHGAPGTRAHSRALKAMPFGKRFWFMFNFPAFFFGWIYFIQKGMTKQGLVLNVITMIVIMLAYLVFIGLLGLGDGFGAGAMVSIWLIYMLLVSTSASYQVYLKEIKHVDAWNPFKGIGWH